MDLAKYKIPGSQEAFYIPDFVTEEEEHYLVRKVSESETSRFADELITK